MKMKIVIICVSLALAGCGSIGGAKVPFPDLPTKLMVEPVALKTVRSTEQNASFKLTDKTDSGIQLSAVSKIITDNYATCNNYREQIFGLQEWMYKQKKLNP